MRSKIITTIKGLLARKRLGALGAAAVALFLTVNPALAWIDDGWSFRKAITIDTNAAGVTEGLKHYPVLIRLDSSRFNFDEAQKNGADLRFVDQDDRTQLAYQIESYDPALGLAMIWVDLPDLQGGSQHRIWMYYGNKAAQSAADPAKVFDPAYRGVYHFAVGAVNQDSSGAHANLSGVTAAPAAAIGGGAALAGTPVNLPLALNPAQGFTISMVEQEKAHSANAVLFALPGSLVIGLKQGVPYIEVAGQHVDAQVAPLSDWASVAVDGDATKTVLYVNGQTAATVNAPVPSLQGTATLGGNGSDPATAFTGTLDEVRVSAAARTPGLIAADYASQRAGAQLVAFGADEKASGIGFGYFGVIFHSLTPDAWGIIVLLLVMAALSWWVMWNKWLGVATAKRANNKFLSTYNKLGGNLAHLDQELLADTSKRKLIERAPLYRIFRTGMGELHKRGNLKGKALTEETVESIRAALDAQQIAENQKLDSSMVLLTICIAGGPFIGLAGTVLGVMITFAAVALSGDVNVNAIAPGISASLLCTLVGLFVAIPALFGYNFISSLNSAESDRARGFADQFVTGLAEAQRDAAMAA